MSLFRRVIRIVKAKIENSISDAGPREFQIESDLSDKTQINYVTVEDRRAYEILELDLEATESDISKSYKRLCRAFHPDKFQQNSEKLEAANKLMAEVGWAYNHLMKRKKKRA